MTTLAAWGRKLVGFFVADALLTAFVPVWMAIVWLCKHGVPGMPARILAVLIACGPILALGWSVAQAARAFQRTARNPR